MTATQLNAMANERQGDRVYTPDWCAKDMVEWFGPSGTILEPCRGSGAIFRYLPEGSLWCELDDGVDFFKWNTKVDWIISNPPYSKLRPWVRHSFKVADNIVYLIPIRNFTSGFGFIREAYDFGGVKQIRMYGTGNRLGFPMGNAVGAVHFCRNYSGDIRMSFYGEDNETHLMDEEERLASIIFDHHSESGVRLSEQDCHIIAKEFLCDH